MQLKEWNKYATFLIQDEELCDVYSWLRIWLWCERQGMNTQQWWRNRSVTIHLEDRKILEVNSKTIPMEAEPGYENLTKLPQDRWFSCYVKSLLVSMI
jgi:hypothetical protein